MAMGKKNLIMNNPLRVLGLEKKVQEKGAGMGLVMARAGLGKTAILVQIALDSMLWGDKVLHVSIGESVHKTKAWYDDILALMAAGEKNDNFQETVAELMHNRMIMTFKESAFSQSRLEERLDDLVQQNIYKPVCLIIDGYDFQAGTHDALQEFKEFMVKHGLKMIWFSATTHRDDDRKSAIGLPAPCHEVEDLFDVALLISPKEQAIELKILKCSSCAMDPGTSLILDASTMLIQKA
jgi:KaiC/GvpD/RAD55 family RecA-like ATPase